MVRPGDIIVADEDGVVVAAQESTRSGGPRAGTGNNNGRVGMYPFMREVQVAVEGHREVQPHLNVTGATAVK